LKNVELFDNYRRKYLKKQIIPITLVIILIIFFTPGNFDAQAAGEFTATLRGQLYANDNDSTGDRSIEDIPEATIPLIIGSPVTISLDFSNPVKFTGNWTGITTNIPVLNDDNAASTGAFITSFIIDGEDLGSRLVPLIDHDDEGFLTIDIARQQDGNHDVYDLAGMEPFTSLEITFIVPSMPEDEAPGGFFGSQELPSENNTDVLENPVESPDPPAVDTPAPTPETAPIEHPEPHREPAVRLPDWFIPVIIGVVVVSGIIIAYALIKK